MDGTSKFICFVCANTYRSSDLQSHVNKCKLSYEQRSGKKYSLPEEYDLLFKAFKGGLALEQDDVENFNNLMQSKLLKPVAFSTPMKSGNMKTKTLCKSPPQSSSKFNATVTAKSRPSGSLSPERLPGQRPRLLVCPLCGKEFGTLSLPIHMKTCRQKFEIEQSLLPKNLRRSADKIIESYNKNSMSLKASGQYSIDQMSSEAFEIFNKEALVPCDVCGRTFLPDRLIVHQRSCKKKKTK